MQLGSQFIDEVLEAYGRVLISVHAEHETLELSFSDIESMLCQHVPQIIRVDDSSLCASKVIKDVTEDEVWATAEAHSQVLHVPLGL